MTVAPLPRPNPARLGTTTTRARPAPSRRGIVARRRTVLWTKRVMPVLALLLLASIALWPEISRQLDKTRFTYRKGGLTADVQAGKLLNVRYHGLDARNRPFTVTADGASQQGPERIDLTNPKGDVVSESGAWTYVQSRAGTYRQQKGLLDLSGDVQLFRDNGVQLQTESLAMDLKAGAAAGNEHTHTEGPFGTIDSEGFALVDKGAVIQFDGKSRMVLNGSHK